MASCKLQVASCKLQPKIQRLKMGSLPERQVERPLSSAPPQSRFSRLHSYDKKPAISDPAQPARPLLVAPLRRKAFDNTSGSLPFLLYPVPLQQAGSRLPFFWPGLQEPHHNHTNMQNTCDMVPDWEGRRGAAQGFKMFAGSAWEGQGPREDSLVRDEQG